MFKAAKLSKSLKYPAKPEIGLSTHSLSTDSSLEYDPTENYFSAELKESSNASRMTACKLSSTSSDKLYMQDRPKNYQNKLKTEVIVLFH